MTRLSPIPIDASYHRRSTPHVVDESFLTERAPQLRKKLTLLESSLWLSIPFETCLGHAIVHHFVRRVPIIEGRCLVMHGAPQVNGLNKCSYPYQAKVSFEFGSLRTTGGQT